MKSVPNLRRQLSLILPEPERSMFDIVRADIDPIQYSLISAHVTLCRNDGCILLPHNSSSTQYSELREYLPRH